MSETKRYECCGVDWSEQVATAGEFTFCPRCGKRFPAPEPAMSEDERMALDMRAAFYADGSGRLDGCVSWGKSGEQASWLRSLAKARSLLEPAAFERGRQAGRREAYEGVRDHAKDMRGGESDGCERANGMDEMCDYFHEWAKLQLREQQRDACGPTKAVPSMADQAREISENPGEPTQELVDLMLDCGPAKAERPVDESQVPTSTTEEEDAITAFDRDRECRDIEVSVAWGMTSVWAKDGYRRIARHFRARESALRAEVERLKASAVARTSECLEAERIRDQAQDEIRDLRAKLAEAKETRKTYGSTVNLCLSLAREHGWPGANPSSEKTCDAAIRILREQKAEIERLTRELEGARKEPVGWTMAKDAARRAFDNGLAQPTVAPASGEAVPVTTLERVRRYKLDVNTAGWAQLILDNNGQWIDRDEVLRAAKEDQAAAVKAATEPLLEKLLGWYRRREEWSVTLANAEKRVAELEAEVDRMRKQVADLAELRAAASKEANANAQAARELDGWKREQQQALIHLSCVLMDAGLVKSRDADCIEVACKAARELAELRELVKRGDVVPPCICNDCARVYHLLHLDQPAAKPGSCPCCRAAWDGVSEHHCHAKPECGSCGGAGEITADDDGRHSVPCPDCAAKPDRLPEGERVAPWIKQGDEKGGA